MALNLSLPGLRILREVAERGSFTAAAAAAGFTQSAVSRQVAALEAAVGKPLFERRPDGVRLTDAGRVLLRHAGRALDEVDQAERELSDDCTRRVPLRLGAFPSAGGWLVPKVAARLTARSDVDLLTRSGSTRSLVRMLRAGTLDLAVLALVPPFRPFDEETPALATTHLVTHELMVAVATSSPLAAAESIDVRDLVDQPWIADRASAGDGGLGVWPGLPGRPRIVHTCTDWLTKLQFVATGAGLTSVPELLVPVLPKGVRALPVTGGSREERRVYLARLPGAPTPAITTVRAALIEVATEDN